MASSGERFIRELVDRVPALGPVLTEHLEDNFGELLPHVFLADVMRQMVQLDSGQEASEEADATGRILEHLEANFGTGDHGLDELISTGFVEVLPRRGEYGHSLRCRLGPKLAAEAKLVA